MTTPDELDGKPMAVRFDEHPTATQTEAAFLTAGRRFDKRLELRTFLPGLQFVAEGFCDMVCDMITADSSLRPGSVTSDLVMRRFRPRIANSVSVLTPASVGRAKLGQACAAHLTRAIAMLHTETEARLSARPAPLPAPDGPGRAV